MPGWLPWAAACAACAAFALVALDAGLWHPGYAYGDERVEICMLQALREGAPFAWDFSRGCLTRAAQWLWVRADGADLGSLHTPELASLALEFFCLTLLARRWFGDEVAAWSVLALALSAQTWVWARSLLAFQALPAEILFLGLLAGRVRGRGAALAWGLAASLVFLDYDGALIAVPGLWLACASLDPAFRRRAVFSALGLALGVSVLLWHDRASLAAYAAVRLGEGLASPGPGWTGRLRFLGDLATGGPALPYFGVSGWPAWPPWAWAGLGLGAWHLRRAPGLALVLWAGAAALATQMVYSGYGFPLHRLVAAAPALALVTGVGLWRLRVRLGSRAWVLGLLLVAGASGEGWAWWRQQQAFAPELYDRCDSLALVRAAYPGDLNDPAVRVVTQLAGSLQADARFVLDRPLALGGPAPARVLAIVPADYAPALKILGIPGAWFWAAKGLEPALVVEARGVQAARLASIEDSLAPLVGDDSRPSLQVQQGLDAWLSAPQTRDPWTLTAALEADCEESLRAGSLSVEARSRLARTRLLSAAPWMALARSVYLGDPRAAVAYCRKAEALDPRDGEALLIEAASLRALRDPDASRVSGAWVALRASGLGWRHTL